MTPCQKLLKQEGTARRIESMQQSSATPSLHLWFLGVAEDCCMLSILLAVPSCFNSFWHGVNPTSYFIFTLVYLNVPQKMDMASFLLSPHSTHVIFRLGQSDTSDQCLRSNQALCIYYTHLYVTCVDVHITCGCKHIHVWHPNLESIHCLKF